ncbi:MAG: class I SAM-dependent methyltransferase [Solirubrobacteraceae bacterium]
MTTLTEKPYLPDLATLKAYADTLPDTRMLAVAKVTAMAIMNMRWEAIMVDRKFPNHPWPHAQRLVQEAHQTLAGWSEAAFIEGPSAPLGTPSDQMEERHHDLFQTLWVNFTEADYEDRIARYGHRLKINDLADGFLQGKRVMDFGCGHGNFLHACLRAGASSGLGIDYGEESIRYSLAARDRLGVDSDTLEFRVESVYQTSVPDASVDVAIQNGVFHHLDDEDGAYREVHRVLRPGGCFWIYTDGAGAVSHDLWDAAVHVLRNVPYDAVLEVLDFLGVETNKRYHLGDGLNAVYRHTTYEDFVERLAGYGFGAPRRLTGGFPTDFDDDVLAADPWGREKFGSGDIRLLVQKL